MNQPDTSTNLKEHGGKRSNAGRKPLPINERRVKLTIWILPKTKKLLGKQAGRIVDILVQ